MKTVACLALPADLCVLAELDNSAIRLSALAHSLNIGLCRVDKVPDADTCKECTSHR